MVVLVVLASLAAAVGLIGSVGAAAPPAVPTITSGPTGTVATSSATFKYADSTSGVSFLCALDSGSFKSCATSGVTYTRLGNGSHVFRVEAKKNNATSAAATRTWTVDTAGPSVAVTFPANLHSYGAATWNAGCAGGPGHLRYGERRDRRRVGQGRRAFPLHPSLLERHELRLERSVPPHGHRHHELAAPDARAAQGHVRGPRVGDRHARQRPCGRRRSCCSP